MAASTIVLVALLSLIKITYQQTLSTLPYYVGAVVEYYPSTIRENCTEFMIENANQYIKFIRNAREKGVDIIVFPEHGLIGDSLYIRNFRTRMLDSASTIPDPEYEQVVLCNDTSSDITEPLKMISCAAKQYAMYVVINIHEIDKYIIGQCNMKECRYLIYSTNVVFDRNGTIISKYRRRYLIDSLPNYNVPPQMSYFHTDFNVTFGHFIGSDIEYKVPAYSLVREKKITDIAYTASWFDILPYHTSAAEQSGYSYYNDVNLLASNIYSPLSGRSGSGIYAGRDGVIRHVFPDRPVNKMIVAHVPKVIDGQRIRSIHSNYTSFVIKESNNNLTVNSSNFELQMLFRQILLHHTTRRIKLRNPMDRATLCRNNICCHFKVTTNVDKNLINNSVEYYRYRFAISSGPWEGKNDSIGYNVCGIISCTSKAQYDCGKRFITGNIVNPVTFISIEIRGVYLKSPNIIHYPVGTTTEIQPMRADHFTFITKNLNQTHVNIKYSLIKPYNNLMTFAIYGHKIKDS